MDLFSRRNGLKSQRLLLGSLLVTLLVSMGLLHTEWVSASNIVSKQPVAPKIIKPSRKPEFPKAGKDVEVLGNNDGSYTIGDTIHFILKGSIPVDIQNYEVYEIIDDFDSQLTPDIESISVYFGSHPLLASEDYTVIYTGSKVVVSLTENGIQKISDTVAEEKRDVVVIDGDDEVAVNDDSQPFIQVNINAKINAEAKLTTDILNRTEIQFDYLKNGRKERYSKPVYSSEVRVYTGGKLFQKIGSSDTDVDKKIHLKGAEFDLLDEDGQPILWNDDLIGANQATAKYKDRFAGTIASGQPIKLKSDKNGVFSIAGLAYGAEVTKRTNDRVTYHATTATNRTYLLKETKAPDGYQLLKEPVKFSIGKNTANAEPAIHLSGNLETIENTKIPTKKRMFPNTGSVGTVIFITGGMVLMFCAARSIIKYEMN